MAHRSADGLFRPESPVAGHLFLPAPRHRCLLQAGWLLLVFAPVCISPTTACRQETAAERRAREQRALRARRLAWVRHQKALARRQAAERARYYQQLQAALHPVQHIGPARDGAVSPGIGSQTTSPVPSDLPPEARPCSDLMHLSWLARRRGRVWNPSARHMLSALSSELLELGGRVYQRLSFAVRMDPRDEPRLGRPPARAELWLTFRWHPVCGAHGLASKSRTLHLALHRRHRGSLHKPPRAILLGPGPWPRRRVPVATRLEILLDLRPPKGVQFSSRRRRGRRPPPRAKERPLGLWTLEAATFAGRARLARLHLRTHAFGSRLARLAAVEVACPHPRRRCRFLTYTDRSGREHPLPLETLLQRAGPVRTRAQARELFAIIKALRYAICSASGRQQPGSGRHPCLRHGPAHDRLACRYYRAMHGIASPLAVARKQDTWQLSQTLRCNRPSGLQVLAVQARFGPGSSLRLTETDLTSRASQLEEKLQRLLQPKPR